MPAHAAHVAAGLQQPARQRVVDGRTPHASSALPRAPLRSSAWRSRRAAAFNYSERGDVLASVARGEHAHARLPAHLDAAGVGEDARMTLPLEPRGDSDSQARTEFAAGWRRVGSMLGVARAELERFVGVAQGVRAAWSRERATPRWHGCYRDRPGDRAMSGGPRTFGHTTQACAAACLC
jgi:hypothetical protein